MTAMAIATSISPPFIGRAVYRVFNGRASAILRTLGVSVVADPFDKVTRSQSSDVLREIVLPGKAGEPGWFGSETPAGVTIRIRILKDGDIEFWEEKAGQEPARVVPTTQQLAYVKELIDSRKEASSPDKATPTPADKLETIKDPRTGQPVKMRDPATGTVIDLPDNTAKGPTTQTFPDGSLRQWNASAGRWDVLDRKPEPTVEVNTGRTYRDSDGTPLRETQKMTIPAATFTLQQARDEDARAQQRLMNEMALQQKTSDQARDELTAIREGLALRLQEAQLASSARAQDISVRNADLDAGVSQRNANLSYGAGMARGAESLATAQLPYLAPKGSNARMDYIIAKGTTEGAPTVAPMGMPFDPATFGLGVSNQAIQSAPSMIMGAPVAAASLPSVTGAYTAAVEDWKKAQPPRMVLGG